MKKHPAARWLWFPLLWLPYAALTIRFWFLCDDAFISFRYARNWALGHGLRYNLGDHAPVEGYSNFLWVAICTILERVGGEITSIIPVLSFACGSVLLYLVFRLLRERLGVGAWPTSLATLSLGLYPPFAVWSTGGLETMAFALLFLGVLDRLLLREPGIGTYSAALLGFALALTRVEGIAWALALGLLALPFRKAEGRRVLRPILVYTGILLAAYALYFVWRYSHFGLPVANTAYAKLNVGAVELGRGVRYVLLFCLTYLTPLLILPTVTLVRRREWRAPALVLTLAMTAVGTFAAVVGGDFMCMGRLLVPALAPQALLTGLLLRSVADRSSHPRTVSALLGATLLLVGLLPAWNLHLVPRPVLASLDVRLNTPGFRTDVEQWRYMTGNTARRTERAEALREHTLPGESIVLGAIGVIGYYTELFVYDRYGLVTREVAVHEQTARLRSPGHDRAVPPEFFLDRRPTYVYARILRGDTKPAIARWAASWERGPFGKAYVAQAIPLRNGIGGEPRVLMLLRLIPESIDASSAWDEFRRGQEAR